MANVLIHSVKNLIISARTAVTDLQHKIRHKAMVHRDVRSTFNSLDV